MTNPRLETGLASSRNPWRSLAILQVMFASMSRLGSRAFSSCKSSISLVGAWSCDRSRGERNEHWFPGASIACSWVALYRRETGSCTGVINSRVWDGEVGLLHSPGRECWREWCGSCSEPRGHLGSGGFWAEAQIELRRSEPDMEAPFRGGTANWLEGYPSESPSGARLFSGTSSSQFSARMHKLGRSRVTVVWGGTDRVSHTLEPMTES